MEIFQKAKVIKLRSHLDKYLVADDDRETVRQSRNGTSNRSKWFVEPITDRNAIRLRSCHGKYLTASNTPFLLGMTGKKVIQTVQSTSLLETKSEPSIEWVPVRDGFQVKLTMTMMTMTRGGVHEKCCYLRANGGTPPWRNSVTCDDPKVGGTMSWVLWDVEIVDVPEFDEVKDYLSKMYSFINITEDDDVSSMGSESPMSIISRFSPKFPSRESNDSPGSMQSKAESRTIHNQIIGEEGDVDEMEGFSSRELGIDLFHNAKSVRLRGRHGKYLIADEDEESISQARNGSTKTARWTVEIAADSPNIIYLKSCFNKYLTASNESFLLGWTGKKVFQSQPHRVDSSVGWEPVREGNFVKLKTRYGQFLRANGGMPPWRNSVTHDIPHRTVTQDWVLWEVDVIEIQVRTPVVESPTTVDHSDSFRSDLSSPTSTISIISSRFSRQESNDSPRSMKSKAEGRTIHYQIIGEEGDVDEAMEGFSFTFRGNGVEELTRKLEEETGMKNILVCTRSPLNQKLYPLRLQLPPRNASMRVVVVPSSSIVARELTK